MKKYTKFFVTALLCLYLGTFASGCTYNTYYDDEMPPGDYTLKDSKPILKEKVVQRHYVVE